MGVKQQFINRVRELGRDGAGSAAPVASTYAVVPPGQPGGQHGNELHNPLFAEEEAFEAHITLIGDATTLGHAKAGTGIDVEEDGTWNVTVVGGATHFTGLTDVDPSTLAGAGGYLVRVNAGATLLEFVDGTTLFAATGHTHTGVYDPAGTGASEAAAAVAAHVLVSDPHTQYHNDARGDARYSLLAHVQAVTAGGTGLTSVAANKIIYTSATDTFAVADVTAFGLSLLDDAAATNGRATLELNAGQAGDIWVEKAGDTMTGGLTVAVTGASTAPFLVESDNPAGGSGTGFSVHVYSTGQAPNVTIARALGTKASLDAAKQVANTNRIVAFNFQGHVGTASGFLNAAQLRVEVDGTVTTSPEAVPGAVRLFTTNATGTSTEAIQWNSGQQTMLATGTVSLPSLAYLTDPNTGMWRPGADTLAFSTGGVEALRMDNAQLATFAADVSVTGSLGIGTAAPAVELELFTFQAGPIMRFSRDDNTVVLNDSLGKIEFWGNDDGLSTKFIFGNIEMLAGRTIPASSDAPTGRLHLRTVGQTTGVDPVDRLVVGPVKNLNDAVSNQLFEITLNAGEMAGGAVVWTIIATDGTDMQTYTGITTYAVVNKAGTYTSQITHNTGNDAKAVSSGTLTTTWNFLNGTNKVTLRVVPTGSLTETTLRILYTVIPNSPQAISFLSA